MEKIVQNTVPCGMITDSYLLNERRTICARHDCGFRFTSCGARMGIRGVKRWVIQDAK